MGIPDSFTLFKVNPEAAPRAFAFHATVASKDPNLWLRTEKEIEGFALAGELMGVLSPSSDELVGLCYATLDEKRNEYEIGGLTILPGYQRLGLAAWLARLTIAYVIANERPCREGRTIVAYVDPANGSPRGLMQSMGFEQIGTESFSKDAAGPLLFDKFNFPLAAVCRLLSWLEQPSASNASGYAHVVIDLGRWITSKDLVAALREEIGTCSQVGG